MLASSTMCEARGVRIPLCCALHWGQERTLYNLSWTISSRQPARWYFLLRYIISYPSSFRSHTFLSWKGR